MKTNRSAKTLGLLAALLIVSLPSGAADHTPYHVSECDSYDWSRELTCTLWRSPIGEAITELENDVFDAWSEFAGAVYTYVCHYVDRLIHPSPCIW